MIGSPLYATTVGVDETPRPGPAEKELFKGLFRGVGRYYSGASWTWFRPIRPGDRLYREYAVLDVQVKENSGFAGGGATVIDTYRYFYVNDIGEPVATHDMSFVNAERMASKTSTEKRKRERQHNTKDEIERIDALYAAEQRRGAETRYWDDVTVGEELTPIVKGPMTIRDVVGFHIGWGFGQLYGAGPLRYAWKHRLRTLALYTIDEYGVPDIVQRLHWEQGRAAEMGQPAPYDYGAMRTNWLAHLVTNCGDVTTPRRRDGGPSDTGSRGRRVAHARQRPACPRGEHRRQERGPPQGGRLRCDMTVGVGFRAASEALSPPVFKPLDAS